MTFKRPAYEEITLRHGGNTLRLRPSLRAATILEDKFGLPAIDKGLAELEFIIVPEIIRAASCNASDAAAFLSGLPGKPLSPSLKPSLIPYTISFACSFRPLSNGWTRRRPASR